MTVENRAVPGVITDLQLKKKGGCWKKVPRVASFWEDEIMEISAKTSNGKPNAPQELRYERLHRPAKEFKNRSDYLDHELQITNLEDKRWGLLKPKKDFRFEWEDFIPAIAATIGSSVLSFGIIGGYVTGFGLSNQFLLENVRLELVLVGLIIIAFMFLNPRLGGIGHHGWMIPLVPAIVAAGGHPLAMGAPDGWPRAAFELYKRRSSVAGADVNRGHCGIADFIRR